MDNWLVWNKLFESGNELERLYDCTLNRKWTEGCSLLQINNLSSWYDTLKVYVKRYERFEFLEEIFKKWQVTRTMHRTSERKNSYWVSCYLLFIHVQVSMILSNCLLMLETKGESQNWQNNCGEWGRIWWSIYVMLNIIKC